MLFDPQGNFNGHIGMFRLRVRDGRNRHNHILARRFLGKHNRAGAVFNPLLAACFMVFAPQIGIADNEARKRIGKWHGFNF
jgi:hypothetical protein